MLVVRTCSPDLLSRNGFQWPESGSVERPDWDAAPQCGNGLHGLPWGEGYCSAFKEYLDIGGKALVVEADDASVVLLEGGMKCKFPRGNVVYSGTLDDAIQYLLANGGAGKAIAHAKITVGPRGTATAGEYGTATAGYGGTATSAPAARPWLATAALLRSSSMTPWRPAIAGRSATSAKTACCRTRSIAS